MGNFSIKLFHKLIMVRNYLFLIYIDDFSKGDAQREGGFYRTPL
jgi:hypothetical protein